jgi:N,N'-diacetyllegionaminate synthase
MKTAAGKKSVNISGREIGESSPCFIIAEAGVNHNGDINLAIKLIDAAVNAGADAVKFQTFNTSDLVIAGAKKAKYQQETTGSQENQYEMLKKLEFKPEDFRKLSNYAHKKGILFLSTPFDEKSVDLLETLNVPAFKIPSGEITNLPLLQHIAHKKKPIILSTGMSVINEIKTAVSTLKKEGTRDIILLHCISSYPALPEDINLKFMATLKRVFRLPVGFSDHTTGIYVPAAAAAMGACVIEKHFTLDKNLPGPDHRASLEPGELKKMVTAIRIVEKALGNGKRRLTKEEKNIKKAARRSLVAVTDIPAGTIIKREMLGIKRPGNGIEPRLIDKVIGKKAKIAIKSDEILTMVKLSR